MSTFSGCLLFAILAATGCSDRTQPLKRSENASAPPVMKAEPGLNPARPGPSQAERSIAQAMQIKRGQDALAARRPEEAVGHLKKALATLPGSPRTAEIHLLLGRAHEMNNQHQQSLVAYEKAVALEASNPMGHYLLALAYKQANRLDQAHKSIRRAITLAPKNLTYRFDLVTIELQLQKKAQAERSFTAYEKLRDDTIAQLKAGPEKKRLAAVRALRSVPTDDKNIDALRSQVGDKSVAIRTAVVAALAESGSKNPRVRQALGDQLSKEPDPAVQKAIRQALAKLPLPPK